MELFHRRKFAGSFAVLQIHPNSGETAASQFHFKAQSAEIQGFLARNGIRVSEIVTDHIRTRPISADINSGRSVRLPL